MTSGIYQLNFNDQAYYIGQSQDMESRWKQHEDKFAKGKSAKKMQDAYDAHGMPTATILLECHKDYLDIMENYYIAQQKTRPNCLNSTTPPLESNIDYDWLLQNVNMLKFSSIDIMRELFTAIQQKNELEAQCKALRTQLEHPVIEAPPEPEPEPSNDPYAELLAYNTRKIAYIQSELARIRAVNHQ